MNTLIRNAVEFFLIIGLFGALAFCVKAVEWLSSDDDRR